MRDTRPADGEDVVNIVGMVALVAVLVIGVALWTFVALDIRLNQIERRLPQTTTTTVQHG